MSQKAEIAIVGIDVGKNSFVPQDAPEDPM
jgi:hypothetical protein